MDEEKESMADDKNKNEEPVVSKNAEGMDQIQLVDLEKTMRDCYIDYAMSVIVSRALPDVRDSIFHGRAGRHAGQAVS